MASLWIGLRVEDDFFVRFCQTRTLVEEMGVEGALYAVVCMYINFSVFLFLKIQMGRLYVVPTVH